jgi:hypothetical protein
MFTARYALSPYIKETRFVFNGLKIYIFTQQNSLNFRYESYFIQVRLH